MATSIMPISGTETIAEESREMLGETVKVR